MFKPEHYDSWAWHVQTALEEQELWEIVAGKETRPVDEKLVGQFDKRQRQAKSFIAMTILPPYSNEVRTLGTAKDIWDYMASNYKEQGLLRWMELSNKYHMMRKTQSMTADEYIRQHKSTHDELQEIVANMEAAEIGRVKRLTPIITFLNGLPEEYIDFARTLENQLDSLTLQDVYSKYRSEEHRTAARAQSMGPSAHDENGIKALAAVSGNCHYCGRHGHYFRDCLKRISDESRQERGSSEGDGPGPSSKPKRVGKVAHTGGF